MRLPVLTWPLLAPQLHVTATTVPWHIVLGALPALKGLHVWLSAATVYSTPSLSRMPDVNLWSLDFGALEPSAAPRVLYTWLIASRGIPQPRRFEISGLPAPLRAVALKDGILGHRFTEILDRLAGEGRNAG